MGQACVYIAIDDNSLDELWQLEDQAFRAAFLEIEDSEKFKRLDIDKIWDVLHCTMTGVSAQNPIEDNRLSELIVGVHPKIFEDEDYSVYVSAIDHSEIMSLVHASAIFDESHILSTIDVTNFQKQKIYPHGIWEEDKYHLIKEMDEALKAIRMFLIESYNNKLHVLVTFV
ncbi:MAG: YfbM family protein [Lentisphaeraceae bacterium]|nr:YfbM family protein [Lentisphaeraceae bacterium]